MMRRVRLVSATPTRHANEGASELVDLLSCSSGRARWGIIMGMELPSSPSGLPSVESFLRSVLRSRLLSRDDLRAALRDIPAPQRQDADAVAEHLVRAGKLSRYQARKLLKGVALGLVLGPYQVLAPIARGGMGKVFLARDTRNSQLLALKILPPRRARVEQRQLARFLREMDLNRRVAHYHLAVTYDAGCLHGVWYLAMEFIPGRTLSRLVSDQGPLRVPRAARLLAEVAEGLHHAHEQGVIHRDLKPSNIMVTPHDHAKVLDLGLAMIEGEVVEDITVVGGKGYIVGTMDYIAPEQSSDSSKADRRSDVYSLGCTLYFSMVGRPPFPGGDAKDKIRRHRREEPQRVSQLRPDLPRDFAGLIHKMMDKDPARRFPTAAAAATALREWAGGETEQPLDQPGSTDYQEAVAAVRAADRLPDGSVTDLPVTDLADDWPDAPPRGRAFWFALVLSFGVTLLVGSALLAWLLTSGW
jgi:serine/threonine protein kinase